MLRQTFIFLCFLILISCQTLPDPVEERPTLEWSQYYTKHYDFSFDNTFISFIENIPQWDNLLSSFKGKPDIHYLEVGVNQGRSAIWVLENILTDSSATLTGIDIFPEGTGLKKRYLSNLKLSGVAHKTKTIEGFSQVELRKLPLNSFDIIYIDGDHRAKSVLADAVLSFDLLKNGGILIFDDYLWLAKNKPAELTPKIAIDSFITTYRNSLEIIYRGADLFIKKREDFCSRFSSFPIGCSPVGQYVYVWNWNGENELYPQDLSEPIELSKRGKFLIEQLIKSTEFGESKLYLECDISEDKDFIHLRERLDLSFDNIALRGDCERIKNVRDPLLAEYHWIEAEHADSIVSPLSIAYDENASNGKYIYSPNGIGNQYVPGLVRATYTVNISQAGEYILWGLVNVADKKDNSFFVQIDDGLNNVWEIETGNQWHWDQVNNRDKQDPVKFILTQGSHTIKVMMREDGTMLDKLLLTNNVDFVPSGKGGAVESQPQ